MRTRRRLHRRRIAAAVVAALVIPVAGPAAALAVPADPEHRRVVTETSGLTPLDSVRPTPLVGDTKVDSPGASRAPQAEPNTIVGDTKVDSPGASRAPQAEPNTIQVVRPERTIVRDTDPVLPIALAGAALLVALGLAGIEVVRARSLRLS